jgi:hypothetical protein
MNETMLGRPPGRNTLAFADLIELWTWLLVVLISGVALAALGLTLLRAPVAAPLVLCCIALHWLLLWRVLLRRRWACMFSSLYGWLFFYPCGGSPYWWHVVGAALMSAVAASVIAGWRELTCGW